MPVPVVPDTVDSSHSARHGMPGIGAAIRLLACAALLLDVTLANAAPFTVSSPALTEGEIVPQAYVGGKPCTGGDASPPLAWSDPPKGTAGYAIIMFDPDSPGRGWLHWAVAGLPASVSRLPANASRSGEIKRLGGIEARNDFGDGGYGGPCPPPGKPHRYQITVYALKTNDLSLAEGRPAEMFQHQIEITALSHATLTVTYGR